MAERGASRALIGALRLVLEDGDRIFSKGHVEESDEAGYADMNGRLHGLIVEEAHSPIIGQALERISHVPFAAPQALAFDKTSLEDMYHRLSYAHRQHHCIVDALERGRGHARRRAHARAYQSGKGELEPARYSRDAPGSIYPIPGGSITRPAIKSATPSSPEVREDLGTLRHFMAALH